MLQKDGLYALLGLIIIIYLIYKHWERNGNI
jgi:hypothetical protein